MAKCFCGSLWGLPVLAIEVSDPNRAIRGEELARGESELDSSAEFFPEFSCVEGLTLLD